MRVRIEKVSGDERTARKHGQGSGTGLKAICYNEEEQYYLTLSEVLTSIYPD